MQNDPRAADSPIATFLYSEDAGRYHFSTLGMHAHGLPELQMKEVAANHCRAVRFLMTVVGRRLVRDSKSIGPEPNVVNRLHKSELALSRDDLLPVEPFLTAGRNPEVVEEGEARVRLEMQLMTSGERSTSKWQAELLALLPPRGATLEADDWLRATCRRLGQDTPAALPPAAQFDEMNRASARARASLPEVRRRFEAGLGDRKLLVKTPLPAGAAGKEYVWAEVGEWNPDGGIVATLIVAPVNCPGYREGQEIRIREAEVFDRSITGPEGIVEPALTDIVAQEFGVDIQQGGGLAPGRIGWKAWPILVLVVVVGSFFRLLVRIIGFFGRFAGSGFDDAEIQKVARNLVDGQKEMFDHRPEYVPARAEGYADFDLTAYDATEKALASLGLPVSGDIEDAAFERKNPGKGGFYRMGLSTDGAIAWAFFALRVPETPGGPVVERRTLVLRTWLEDGRLLVTARVNPPLPSLLPDPPTVVKHEVPPEASDSDAVRVHRERVAAAGSAPQRLRNLEVVLDLLREEGDAAARYRGGLGVELYRQIVVNSQGEEGRDLADAIVKVIRAHPEWLD